MDAFNNRVLLPKDMANYSITDYFNLKFITDLGTLEQVPLDQIRKITRQGGKKLFIHGKFGSRGMTFFNKQKRDECISAIEDAARVSASLEFDADRGQPRKLRLGQQATVDQRLTCHPKLRQ